jgi:hypothetical protein
VPRQAQNKSIYYWERLAEACQGNPKLRALFHRELALLNQTAKDMRAILAKRARLEGEKQSATRECNAAFAKGSDLSSRIRLAVKATLGPRDERLTQFGIKPRSRRGER